jgi:hypothetical protein
VAVGPAPLQKREQRGTQRGLCDDRRLREDSAMQSRWAELVDDARWAPSPHNVQPWLVRPLAATEAELLCDPVRTLPDTDPAGRFVTVGLGVFVESLAIAAAARGLRLEVVYEGTRVDPRASAPVPFAHLSLTARDVEEPLGVALLRERRTSRTPYDGRPAADGVLERLRALAAPDGHTLRWSHDPALVAAVLALNEETLFFDMTDPVARREIGRWVRFSAAEAARRRDGFSPATLGFPGPLLKLFFRDQRLLAMPGARGGVRRLYRRTMRGTRTVAWLQGPFEHPHHWLAAGRLLQRLWLTMTAQGLQLHPFGSIVTNDEANAQAHELLELTPDAGIFWLVLRLGYGAKPPRSHRLETERLLVA